MTVSKDVRAKEYNGARSASSALKIEKVETHANIKVQGSTASMGAENASTTSVGKTDANVVDLKRGNTSLKDFGVDLTSGPEPKQKSKDTSKEAPLKAVQAETNGPSYKFLIGIAAALVVVIAGLTIWSGGLNSAETVTAAAVVDTPQTPVMAEPAAVETAAVVPVAQTETPVESVSENEFVAQMTAGTIAALRAGASAPATNAAADTAAVAGAAQTAAATLFTMVMDATAKNLSIPEIDHMLNVAYTDGTIKVPEPFLLSSGRVNTSAIMTAFVGN